MTTREALATPLGLLLVLLTLAIGVSIPIVVLGFTFGWRATFNELRAMMRRRSP